MEAGKFEMSKAQDNYDLLIAKLEQFVRKYYTNQLIRGSIYFMALLLGFYLIDSLLEYLFVLPPVQKKVILLITFASLFLGFVYWIVIPLARLLHIGKRMSREQAAQIVGSHFDEIQDKLLNVLQLKSQAGSMEDSSLLLAGINQKIEQIKPVPILRAIRFSANKKYLRYALVPLAVIFFLLLGAPDVLRESNRRLINTNTDFRKIAPFKMRVEEPSDLSVIQFDDLTVTVKVDGEVLPDKVSALSSDYSYPLKKNDAHTFTYTFRKVREDFTFRLGANGFFTEEYHVKVLPKPSLLNFDIRLTYPAYTGRKEEVKHNLGDLLLPLGTRVSWVFHTRNTEEIALRLNEDTLVNARPRGEGIFEYSLPLKQDLNYTIFNSNRYIDKADSISYSLRVIPDRYPSINVSEYRDSSKRHMVYFLGTAADDYGISRIDFRYRIENAESKEDYQSLPVGGAGKSKEQFDLSWNIAELNLAPGDRLSYHFIVWDNDAINGRKFTRSREFYYRLPSKKEIEEKIEEQSRDLERKMEEKLEEARKIKEEIKALRERLLQKKELRWEDKKAFEELLQRHKELQDELERMKNELQEKSRQEDELNKLDEETKEKQKKLEEMMEEMLDEESKKLMEKIEELMKDLDQEKALEKLEEFEMSNEAFEKNFERLQELYKELEFEKKLQDNQKKLDELAEKQEALSKESEKEESNPEELAEKQEELNKEFEEFKKDMEEMEKMNEELENSKDLDDFSEQEESIQQEMNESKKSLDKKQKNDASRKQKSASEKMKEMSDQMSEMQASMEMEQIEIDIEATKQLLENLLTLSFEQEALMKKIKSSNPNSPRYPELIDEQNTIKRDFRMVEDSLQALSKRVFQLTPFITKEVGRVKENMSGSITAFADRKKNIGLSKQQYAMTGLNNLALLLDELLQNLQQQAASMMSGSQMCQKPNSSGQSMKKLRQKQQQLSDKIGQMQQEQKEGKPKESGKSGQNGLDSEEIARLARQQRMLRKEIQKLNQKFNKNGKKPYGNLDEMIKEMEKVEEDLVNKRLSEELFKRLKKIETRLLEAEKAEEKQEMSPERKAEQAREEEKELPPEIEEYLKQRKAEIDLYQTVPPTLNPFYRDIVNEYFKSITKFNP